MSGPSTLPRWRTCLSVIGLLLLWGCAGDGSRQAPAPDMPLAWAEADATDAALPPPDWWRGFRSAGLSALIEAALIASPDMAIAAERVRQAEAQARIAGATLFPALNFNAATAGRETHPDGGPWTGTNSASAGLGASYELDVWGRNASGVRAAQASLRASRFDRETVRLTLIAGVASGYFQVLSLRGRIVIARENLAIAERVFKVVDARARYGVVSALDVARQQATVLSQRAAVVPLALQERQTLFALAILAGRQPEGADAIDSLAPAAPAAMSAIAIPPVSAGIPSMLLLRRPDLASAEAQLAAANASVAAARAALLPAISLTGSAGLASEVLINFLNAPTATLTLGAALLQPIFDGGRLRAQVDLAASRERELVENYRKFVLAALADVETTLAAAARGAEQEALQQQVLDQARRALQLAEVRYRGGADDLLSVLDAQRTLFQAEDQLAQLRLARLQAAVSLFKALGGGWSGSATARATEPDPFAPVPRVFP
jgi:NodT family efflux transporter outer membrane factor (OMF) lipoprotein